LSFTNQSYAIYWVNYFAAVDTFRSNMAARFAAFLVQYAALSSNPYKPTGSYSNAWDAWLAQLQFMDQAITAMTTANSNGTSLQPAFLQHHTLAGGNYASQQGVIATANVTAANAVTAKKEAEASLASAQAAEDAALAAVLAVCPDFDPASV
jgi:hypothetical protein